MELQHINVKLLSENQDIDLEAIVPVFHSWIQRQALPGRLLDIADYRHVHAGPGVVLIGFDGDFSVDNSHGRMGVRYNRKQPLLHGSNLGRLVEAAQLAVSACRMLEDEPRLGGKVRFNRRDVEVFVNDRLLAPNVEKTRHEAEPELRAFAQQLFAGGEYSLSYETDSRKLFTAFLKTSLPISLADLEQNLAVQPA